MTGSVHLRCVALLAMCVVIASCRRDSGGDPDASVADSAADAPANLNADTADPDAPPVVTARDVLVALSGEGLQFVDGRTGRTRVLPFGAEREMLQGAVNALGWSGEGTSCGLAAGVLFDNGLEVWFEGGRFTGWRAVQGTATGGLSTMAGIGPGSTQGELLDAYAANVTEAEGGARFSAGDLHGTIAAAGDSARITSMWAGSVCSPA